MTEPRRVVLLGAAGRDFHNFNVVYRDDPASAVVAFTATQIPGIAHRRYPPALAGPRYPGGIPIEDEADLEAICRRERVTQVVFAYSDVPHSHVMTLASRALALGADFTLLGPDRTMLRAPVPVVAVSAVRTGCGKSPIARWLARPAARGRTSRRRRPPSDAVRRPRAAARPALRHRPPISTPPAAPSRSARSTSRTWRPATSSSPASTTRRSSPGAGAEADVLVWDGGNNDFPFVRPDLHLVVADALRPDDAAGYHPGEAVLRMADVVVVSKVEHGLRRADRPGRGDRRPA